VSLEATATDPVQMTLLDAVGREVWSGQFDTHPGLNEWPVALNGLATGVYQLKVTQGGETRSAKVLVE